MFKVLNSNSLEVTGLIRSCFWNDATAQMFSQWEITLLPLMNKTRDWVRYDTLSPSGFTALLAAITNIPRNTDIQECSFQLQNAPASPLHARTQSQGGKLKKRRDCFIVTFMTWTPCWQDWPRVILAYCTDVMKSAVVVLWGWDWWRTFPDLHAGVGPSQKSHYHFV